MSSDLRRGGVKFAVKKGSMIVVSRLCTALLVVSFASAFSCNDMLSGIGTG